MIYRVGYSEFLAIILIVFTQFVEFIRERLLLSLKKPQKNKKNNLNLNDFFYEKLKG